MSVFNLFFFDERCVILCLCSGFNSGSDRFGTIPQHRKQGTQQPEGKENHDEQSRHSCLHRHLRGHTCGHTNRRAQFSAPPQIGLEPPQALPARDISAEVETMTKRYGLSEDEAKIVHAILEEQARKADDVAKDTSLSPEERVPPHVGD